MRRFRYALVALSLALGTAATAETRVGVSIGIWTPNVTLGINLPHFPDLYPVPGYPVYYAPRIHANYFFYDGMFWLYHDDDWYCSYWYDGPWWFVEPVFVPLFILRVPVFYYMRAPVHFHRWHLRHPPRWGEHWGHAWERQRSGWDRWERHAVPPPAPLPVYQRQYSGEKYPDVEHQLELRDRYYRYQPRDATYREHIQPQIDRRPPSPPAAMPKAPSSLKQRLPDTRHAEPPERLAPSSSVKEKIGESAPAPVEKVFPPFERDKQKSRLPAKRQESIRRVEQKGKPPAIKPSQKDTRPDPPPASYRIDERKSSPKPAPPPSREKRRAIEDSHQQTTSAPAVGLERGQKRHDPTKRDRETGVNERHDQGRDQKGRGD